MKQTIIPYYANVEHSRLCELGVEVVVAEGAAIAHIQGGNEELQRLMSHPCRLDAIVMLVCVKGEVSFSSQMSDHTLKAGEASIDTISMMQFRNIADSEFYLLAFKSELLTKINLDVRSMANMLTVLRSGANRIALDNGNLEQLATTFRLMAGVYSAPQRGRYRELSLRHLFASMLYLVFDEIVGGVEEKSSSVGSAKERGAEYYERLMRLIAENYREHRNVEFYAEKMNISPKHLSRVVRGITGKSVHQWIDEVVVLEIKNLLKYSDMSIQQISYALNFPNPSFMGQYFKRITGMTPGEYKRS